MGADPSSGSVLGGRYRIDRMVKDGQFARTFHGRDLLTDVPIVIKTTAADNMVGGAAERLEHEAAVLASLETVELVSLLAIGRQRDLVYLVTPFVAGSPLDARLREGPLSLAETLTVARGVLRALVHIHSHDILHGDVKPANIIVDGRTTVERAVLIDFGLARSASLDKGIAGRPVGTARYVSPEQAGLLDFRPDERADLYSVGILLFECLAGHTPFDAETVGELLRQHLSTSPPSLRSLGIRVAGALDDLLRRLLMKDPRDRYQSAQAALHDVEQIAAAVACGDPEPDIVIGLRDHRSTLIEPEFVGRAEELHALEAQVLAAGRGHGGLVLLEAESGGGKSCVLDEFAQRCAARGAWLLRGQGLDQAATVPLQLLAGVQEGVAAAMADDPVRAAATRAALGKHVDAVCRALPRLAAVFGSDEGVTLGPEGFGEGRTLDALCAFLHALGSAEQPAVVLLDDCQWADELTLQLLERWSVGGEGSTRNAVIVGAFRSEEVPEGHGLRRLAPAVHLRLPPFAPVDVRLLVESMAGPLPSTVVRTVQELSQGNPFMASAVLRGLVESEALVGTPSGWRLEEQAIGDVQSSREAARFLTRRLELLPDPTLHLLSVGAVLGKSFDVVLAADLAGQPTAEAVTNLQEARRRHIVWEEVESNRCSFVHDKLREALLARLSEAERRGLHRLAAERLEQLDGERLFALAYHFDAAGEHERALPYALAAGTRAREQHALQAAEEQYRIALRGSSGADDAVRRRTVQELGEVLMLRGRYDEAAERLAEAGLLAADDATRAQTEAQLGELAFKRGDVRGGAAALERALHLLHQRVPRRKPALAAWLVWEVVVQSLHTALPRVFLARRSGEDADTAFLVIHIYSRLAYAYWFGRGAIACAWAHLREMNLAERYPPGPALAQAYSEHAPVLTVLPLFGRGIAYAQRSLGIRRDLGDLWGQGQSLHFYGAGLYGASRYREAMTRCREAAQLLEQTGDRWEVNTANWHVAYCQYRLGALDEAVAAARDTYRAGVEIGDAQAAGISLSVWAKASCGRIPQELIEAELARGSDDGHTSAEVLQAQAVWLLRASRAEEAVAVLEQARELVAQKGLRQEYVAPVLPWLATARRHQVMAAQDLTPQRRTRLLREARRAARRARWLARWYRNNLPHALRETGLIAAMTGRPSAARKHLDRSLAIAARQSAGWEHAQTLMARGRIGLEAGWPGAEDDVAAATAAMRELDVDVPALGAHAPGQPPFEGRAEDRATLSLADRFDTVLEAGRHIAAALTRDDIFEAVRNAAQILLRGERCVLLNVGPGDREDATVVSSEFDGAVDELCRQLVRQVVATGRVAILDGGGAGPAVAPATGDIRSALCAPVLVRDRLVGSFYVSHTRVSGLFGKEEERLAEFIAALAGAALENAEGFSEVQALTRTLEDRVEERTTQLAAVNRELAHQAFHDPLTQLANRILFRDRVQHAISRRQRRASPLAVLLVDLDDFKNVNDTWGHAAGDELLVGVAERLGRCLRSADTLARLGGDEFGILLEDPHEATAAAAVAERIVEALEPPFPLHGAEVRIHASIGIAVTDGHQEEAEELFRKADTAMYAAKEQGKDRAAVFQPHMLAAVVTRGRMRADLQLAIEEHPDSEHGTHEFVVHYQPIIDLRSGHVASVEALVRWNRPGRGLTQPGDFIPLAEESGFIVAIGNSVLGRACEQVAAWQQTEALGRRLGLHVNLSARQLQDTALVSTVADLLTRTGLVAGSLVLEITESGLMQDPDAAAVQLRALRGLGVRLALDDFGTGYSSLAHLQQFPIQMLKVDKAFVADMGKDHASSSLARAIVQLGHTLDLVVVAEGVELPAQATELQTMACHLGQGYLWSRALPAQALSRWMGDQGARPPRSLLPAAPAAD